MHRLSLRGIFLLCLAVLSGGHPACAGSNQVLGTQGGTDSGARPQEASTLGGVDCTKGPNFTGCPCSAGETRACYTGSAATRHVGSCKDGTQSCINQGGERLDDVFGACEGEVLPSASSECVSTSTDGGHGVVDGSTSESDAPAPPPAAPRPIAPLSVSTVTSQQPTLHWKLPPGADGAHVELCKDRGCATLITAFEAPSEQGAPSAPLAPGVVFWRLASTTNGMIGASYSPTWEFVVGHRSAPIDTSWSATLDWNGDGFADLAVGASGDNSMNAGSVFLYTGSSTGLSAAMPPSLSDGQADNGFGWVVRSIGDVNGDGFGDVAIGTNPAATLGEPTLQIYLGGASGLSAAPVAAIPGISLAGTGDMNGDGYADIVVQRGSLPASAADVYFGGASGLPLVPSLTLDVPTLAPNPCAGGSSLGLVGGDFNGDGFGDVALSSADFSCAGSVYIYLGGAGGPAAAPTGTLIDATANDEFAETLAIADIDGDGLPELICGTGTMDRSDSKILVYAGNASGAFTSPPLVRHHPDSSEEFSDGGSFGLSLASGGDTNGDGFEDLVVSDITASDNGQTYVYLGGPTGLAALPSQTLSASGNDLYFGSNVGGLGDVNGDGLCDVAVATRNYQGGSAQAVYVLPGSATGVQTSPMATFEDTTVEAAFGQSFGCRQ